MSNGKLKGGARPGAGRKPREVEKGLNEAINQALTESGTDKITSLWKQIIEKAEAGSFQHVQLLFNYYYGKPKESLSVSGGMTLTIKRKVV